MNLRSKISVYITCLRPVMTCMPLKQERKRASQTPTKNNEDFKVHHRQHSAA